MSHILLISDTHGHFDVLESILSYEVQQGKTISSVLHCGDIGIYDSENLDRLPKREQRLLLRYQTPTHLFSPYFLGEKHLPVPLYGIPGNHEDFELTSLLESKRTQISNLHILSPGEIVTLTLGSQKIKVMGLGRILPDGVSAKSRNKAKFISKKDFELTQQRIKQELPDILLLHEAPRLKGRNDRFFGSSPLLGLIEEAQPPIVLFGHMHFETKTTVGASRVYGLGYGVAGYYALLNENLQIQFQYNI